MKKALVLMLAMLMIVSLIGCSSQTAADPEPNDEGTAVEENTTEENGIAKIGLGTVTSIAKSTDADGDKLAMAQVDTTIAAVAFDAEGKVVKVAIDVAQTKVNYDEELQLTSDVNDEYLTKAELGADYGMKVASGIEKEWDEQIAELENWMVGKTVAEIKGMKVAEGRPDEAELTSTVTVRVGDYIAAVEEAYATAVEVESGAVELGLGHVISIAKSKGLDTAGSVLPLAQVDTTIAVTAFDAEGKVMGTLIDVAQTKVEFDAEGKVTSDREAKYLTKVELGADYGMKVASGIEKEWDEQIAELQNWMVGKTVAEIKGMKVAEGRPDEAELTSTVTVRVGDYIAAVEEAYTNAK